jgi:uncharacterized membrane protein HdeD (DUF308 family)
MILFTPDLALDLWFFFLAVSLLIIGLARIILGIRTEVLVNWFRIYLVVVGVVTIILSVLIFTTPAVGELYIVILVAVGLLINGSARLIRGVLGK